MPAKRSLDPRPSTSGGGQDVGQGGGGPLGTIIVRQYLDSAVLAESEHRIRMNKQARR